MAEEMSFDEWMRIGITNRWCGPPVCYTHDGLPATNGEEEMWADGDEPCIHIVRMYESAEHADLVEEAHSPTNWRNHYTQVGDK